MPKAVKRVRGFMMRILPMRPRSIQRATKRLRIVIAPPCFRSSPKVLDSRDETVMRAGAA